MLKAYCSYPLRMCDLFVDVAIADPHFEGTEAHLLANWKH